MNSRERVFAAMDNKPVDRVPFAFWRHFLMDEHIVDGLKDPGVMETNYEGHVRFVQEVRPDFVKIMTDGLFHFSGLEVNAIRTVKDLEGFKELRDDDPWIEANVRHAERVVRLHPELCHFYNVFSPAIILRIHIGEDRFFDLLREDRAKFLRALEVYGQGIAKMVRRVLKETEVDGVYYSVQNPNVERMGDDEYRELLRPSDLIALDAANELSGWNILHVCGYDGRRNHLEAWADYPSKSVNWAVRVEGVGLSQGRDIFGGRAVLGGFGNTTRDLLFTGPRDEIEARVAEIVHDAGTIGTIVAADCSLPYAVPHEHLVWVREKLYSMFPGGH
ncbi:MAG TPA: uroporphyrinogen decarboxylase family protein [Candidatus Limnocylindria bacterium]|nr:uroporphyrinogen decarboxylase family protein [Candidatus Limnocylindria bacterium]